MGSESFIIHFNPLFRILFKSKREIASLIGIFITCYPLLRRFLRFFFLSFFGWQRDSPVRGAGYEPFDSILFRIEVRRAKRSQSDAVRTMLGRCVIRKAAVQSFHPRDNTPS